MVTHIECTAQSREDLLDRAVTRLNGDGLRAAANPGFRERRSRRNRHRDAEDNRRPQAELRQSDDAYRDAC
jgi:hypothetical protein